MKKILLLLCLTTLIYKAQAQTTYYWVGGTATSSIRTNANWNTALNGSGTVRTVNATDDILIFDGSNIGGATAATGTINATVSSDSSSKFIFQNNANVIFTRPAAGGGSGTLSLIGGTGDDFVIDATSSVTISCSAADGNVVMNLFPGATGSVAGNLTLSGTGVHRLTSQTQYGLVFKPTAICTLATTPASSGYPFGSATQGVNNGIVFQSGATLITSGTYSPMGGTSTHQAALLLPGSKYYIKSTNAASTGSWTSNKYFGNVYIQNGASVTGDGSTLYMDNLTIDAGCTFTTHTSGSTPITGNLVVNGTLTSPAASTNTLVFGGNGAQTLTGSGSLNIASLSVGDNSDLTISNNVNVANSAQITGKINFGTNVIAGLGTFSSRTNPTALAMTGNVNADSFRVNNTSIAGTPTAPSGLVGLTVTGAGIQPNTTVIATSGGNFYLILSKPATITGTAVPLTFTGGTSTLTTANPNGFDSTNGCVTVTGKKTFQAGTNYVINAATTKPIGITTGQDSAMTVGNLTLNAAATTNINTKVNGVLTLNNGKLSVRESDTVRIANTGSIAGAPFSSAKYIALNAAASKVGALKIDSFNLSKSFPIGTSTDYLPVSITPSAGYVEFIASVFQGLTTDGTINGTPLTATQKSNVVDAVWNLNRIAGTANCDVSLDWTSNLAGSNFTGFADAQIGATNYNAAIWTPALSTAASNALNSATAAFTTFGAIAIGKLNDLLPVKLYNLKATLNNSAATISWSVANEIDVNKYVVERSNDGRSFEKVGEVLALNKNENNYQFINNNVIAGTYYFRVVSVDKSGKTVYSQILKVSAQTKLSVSAYPNPASKQIVIAGVANGATLQITNAIGKMVYKNVATAQSQVIETSSLLSGVYFINVTNVDGTTNTVSFIKK
jgi:hypothetical protein